MIGFLLYMLGLGTGSWAVANSIGRHNMGRKESYLDTMGFVFVCSCFIAYPMLCQKLLRTFKARQFGEFKVLEEVQCIRLEPASGNYMI